MLSRFIVSILVVIASYSYPAYADSISKKDVTKYYSISPPAFVPLDNQITWRRNQSELYSTGGRYQYYAPVVLPDGVRVVEFNVGVYAKQISSGLTVTLWRSSLRCDESEEMAITKFGQTTGLSDHSQTSIEFDIIDNANFSYTVEVKAKMDDVIRLRGISIGYEIIE